MKTYSAITIGPIGHTFSLARKPREFWAASYLFSHLMKCIINKIGTDNIISPSEVTEDKLGVGLYPDRVYFKGDHAVDTNEILREFCNSLNLNEKTSEYFKVLIADPHVYNSKEQAIKELNKELDRLELTNYTFSKNAEQEIRTLLQKENKEVKEKEHKSKWPEAFCSAFANGRFDIDSLGEIGARQLYFDKNPNWNSFVEKLNKDQTKGKEDPFKEFGDKLKSYHKYICIVKADGDNMGKTIEKGSIKKISEKLIAYAQEVVPIISKYGAVPIYAGGDDLLFIAPVVGEKEGEIQNIFDLIGDIDKVFANHFDKMEGKPSLSYGVSITYYKFPLYEAWEKADLLVKTAKKVDGKNAIAWELQKHSGSSFTGAFSKSNKVFYDAFTHLLKESQPETIVAAVSHKLRENDMLLNMIKGSDNKDVRTDAFFDKIVGMSEAKSYKEGVRDPYEACKEAGEEAGEAKSYKECVRDLLKQLYEEEKIKKSHHPNDSKATEDEKKENLSLLAKYIYGMLRTAKFINGEEDKQ